MNLTPADYVIHSFGGVRQTARMLNVAPSTVSRWSSRENKFGQQGTVPSKWHNIILRHAKRLKLDLTEVNLIKGKRIKK